MKIMHIIPSLGNGGAEKFVVELTNELSKKHETILVSFKNINDKMFFVKSVSSRVRVVTLNKKKGIDIRFFLRLISFISDEKPEIINSHLSAINYLFVTALFSRKTRYFHTVHSIAQFETGLRFIQVLKQICFKHKIINPICLSEKIRESYNKIYISQQPTVIFNGVKAIEKSVHFEDVKKEIESYKSDSFTKTFLIVSRFSEEKNLSMITKVFNKLFYEKKNVILIMIGEDPSVEKNTWNQVLQNRSVNTFMLGPKPNVADYLICSDALCLCSLYEGMPIVILEAYSAGIPVISTPVGGIPDILIENRNGILSTDTQVNSYYYAIEKFLSMTYKEIENIRMKNEFDFKEKYTIEIASKNYERLYFSKD